MNTKSNSNQFKPSTYCDNVSEPLLERIKELEDELSVLKKQVQALQFDKIFKPRQLPHEAVSLPRINNRALDQKGV